jgi:putative N6-adenine-specific DNA methylase
MFLCDEPCIHQIMPFFHEKRIKRHVVGKVHNFFAVTAPGFETLCLAELTSLGLEGRAVPGGVEFAGNLQACYLANLCLRTAGRILMRVHSFRATSFPVLERAASRFPWELFLLRGPAPRLHVTTHHCRLHHTTAIAERVLSGIQKQLGHAADGADKPADAAEVRPQVFIRGTDDRFVVSIDSSGENLYLRGIKVHRGRAPVRETIAAAVLMHAGFTGAEVLVDPMCGTGTFSLEAALMAKRIPPGWFRSFAFTSWPAFRKQRWEFMRRKAAERFEILKAPRIFASDIDPDACSLLEEVSCAKGLADAVSVSIHDFFEIDPARLADRPGVVVLNPPYGRRIGKPAESRNLTRTVIDRLCGKFQGWKFILLVPEDRYIPSMPPSVLSYRVLHGGLRVKVIVGEIR